MSPQTAAKYFVGTFSPAEREFLFAHPEFQKFLHHSTEELGDLKKLNNVGVKLLRNGGYQPPVASAPAPGVSAPAPL